ncbi:MAG: hypothetical protein IPK53_03935 [bacterium]|nr:hypothetical protein [bacterium]
MSWPAETRQYSLHQFMPFKGISGIRLALCLYAAMRRTDRTNLRFAYDTRLTFIANRVAEDFMIPGFRGKIGFIASMSQSFLFTMLALRLAADGALAYVYSIQLKHNPARTATGRASGNHIKV